MPIEMFLLFKEAVDHHQYILSYRYEVIQCFERIYDEKKFLQFETFYYLNK